MPKILGRQARRPEPDPGDYVTELNKQQKALFENLMLFDKLSLRIVGESVSIPLLINLFGEKGFDALLEQGAIEFVLWTNQVVFLTQNIPGVDAMASMNFNSPQHTDPEQSIELGLRWMINAPVGRRRRQLIRRIVPAFRVTENGAAAKALDVVRESLKNGGLEHYGIPKIEQYADKLTEREKKVVVKCAEDFAEYNFLLKNNMTSLSDYRYFSPFWATAERFQIMNRTMSGFSSMSTLEDLPDLRALFDELHEPLKKLPRLRQTRNAKQFRMWLEKTAGTSPDGEMVKAYLNAISERKGLLDSAKGKFVKSVAMASVGMGVGAIAGGEAGALAGAGLGVIAEKIGEFVAGTGLELLDSFVMERVTKGWSPRLFFDDLSKLQREAKKRG